MADITYLPNLHVGQKEKRNGSNASKANIPRLASSVNTASTIFEFTYPVGLDEDGSVLSIPTIVSIKNEAGYTEHIYAQAAEWSTDGKTLTITSVDQRGLELSGDNGINITTGVSANRANHESGSEVRIGVSPLYWYAMVQAMQGNIASGSANWKIGKDADENITVYAANGDANEPFFQYNASTNQWVYSNDGVSSTGFGTGAGVTGGDGITVTAGDIDIDTTDTTVFVVTTAGAGSSGKVAIFDTNGLIKQANIEGWKDVTATATEINQALDGISANVTDTNLNTLTAGTTSDASALHEHQARIASSAYAASGQAINVDAKVVLDTEDYDVGSDFDNTTNYRFTAPEDGYYLVNFSVMFDQDAAVTAYVQKNGTTEVITAKNDDGTGGGDDTSAGGSKVLSLNATDYLELRAVAATGNTVAGTNNTYMSVFKIG